MMRVLHVSPTYFGPRGIVGGGERYPLELAKAMAERTPTCLITFGETSDRYSVGSLSVRVLQSRWRWKGSEVNPVAFRLLPLMAKADVIHAHQWESIVTNECVILGRTLGKRVFATDHGGAGKNYWRRLRLQRLLTGFLPVSRFGAECYPELRERAQVILGGVDTGRYVMGTGARRRQAVFVGRLLPHKGIDRLIRSLKPETRLLVLGTAYDTAYRDHLHELAVGKNVQFVEDAGDERVIEAYSQSRASVLPSVYDPTYGPRSAKPELLGLTLLEAMACATPVVCTAAGGMTDIVADGVNGFVVPPGNEALLGHRVEELLDASPARWESMSRAAVQFVRARMSWDAVAERCLRIYAGELLDTPLGPEMAE